MNIVEIDIDESNEQYILRGSLDQILQNRRAKFYLQDFLNSEFQSDCIVIPYKVEEKEDTLRKIQDSLIKYGVKQQESTKVKQNLSAYFTEREKFAEFSAKAKAIWHNRVDIEEFRAFEESVRHNIPVRRLYPKQLLAAFHLAFSQNACNFSVPGAGKTSIVYAAYAYLKSLPQNHPKKVNKLLIIGPLSSFGPWENEYEECYNRKVASKRLSGGVSKDERNEHLLSLEEIEQTPELTLMSYQSVSYNVENLKLYLQRVGNKVMVVLDEAHKIKNVEGGVWANAVLSLAKLCSSRVVLTGTPTPNGYEDIYNLYEFIWPDKKVINFNVYQLRDMSNNRFDLRVEQLIDSISPFFIRIKKSDLDLPPICNHEPTIVPMGQVQREIYDAIENQYLQYFEENEANLAVAAELTKARFIRLMQAATNPALLLQPLERFLIEEGLTENLFIDDSQLMHRIANYKTLEPIPEKFRVIKEKVEEIINKGEKVVLWGTFIRTIKQLQQYLRENGIDSELLIGEVPVDRLDLPDETLTREKIIKEFHNPDSKFKVIIANPFAVAESISLHKACHNAIYFERTFNAANFIQSKDRIHRVGLLPGTITYYHYIVSQNSVEETIHDRLVEKEERMLRLIESQEIPLMRENMDFDLDFESDVKAIIRDYVRRVAKV